MKEQEQEKTPHYWDIKEEKGLLNLLDPDKHIHAYIKWDGNVHLWYYDTNTVGFDHDTGLEDHSEWGFTDKSNHDLYRLVDIDEEIARLQALKDIAVKWFDERRNQHWPPDFDKFPNFSVRADEPAWNAPSREWKEES